MGCTCIPYTRVPKSSALLTDYLYHFDRVSHFYSGAPFEPASHQSVAGKIAISDDSRRQLASVLTRQNQSFGSGEPTFENIRLLGEPGTVAVVTGQQVGLLTGPVFTLYKALTAVRMARSLNDQGTRAVPVFWLATEDHDLEEVAQAAVFDDEYNLVALRDAGVRPAERSSVGVVQLSAEIIPTLEKLESLLPAGDPRARLMIDLRECYVPGATWGQAFGRFMAKLFSRWGVILLDPLDVEIHKLAKPVYEHALTHAQDLRRRLLERWAELVRSGHHAQVHVTDDSTLLFLPKREFLELCRRNSEVAFAIIRTLAWRFRYMASLVEELSLKEGSHRLARFLRDRALDSGNRTKRGIEFPLEETNQQIAAEIGTVRDLVSRNLRRFVDRGIIKMERRKVIVLNMADLEEQATGAKRASG